MKTFDKDKQDEEEFKRRAEADRKHADRAKASMALANRPAGSKERPATIAVNVRANPRPGHDGFRRGGYLWPSDPDGVDVAVTEQLYECLEHEPNVNVRRIEKDASTLEPRDVPERHVAPMPEVPGGRQVSPREIELESQLRIAHLEAELAQMKAGAGKSTEQAPGLSMSTPAGGDDGDGKGKGGSKK